MTEYATAKTGEYASDITVPNLRRTHLLQKIADFKNMFSENMFPERRQRALSNRKYPRTNIRADFLCQMEIILQYKQGGTLNREKNILDKNQDI